MGSRSTEIVKKVDKAIASVTKGIDRKEDMMITLAPYANWGQFLVPAPSSIELLGDLILLSAGTDFSLEKKPPKDGFKLLRYPSSFHACLVQVSNAGWDAFNAAHTNMDQIRLHSANVDSHVRNAAKFLIGGTNAEVKLMVPKALKNVQRIADECVSLVTSVDEKFLSVMQLTAELLEACTNVKGQYDDDFKEAEIGLKIAQEQKKIKEEQKGNAEKQYEDMKKEMEGYQKMMKDAVNSIPSGWGIIGMNFVEGITSGVGNVLNAFTMTGLRKGPTQMSTSMAASSSSAYSETNLAEKTRQQEANRKAYSKAPELMAEVEALGDLLNKGSPNLEELTSGDRLGFVNGRLKYSVRDLKELAKTPVQAEALKLHQTAQEVCSDLKQAAKSYVQDSEEMSKLVKRYSQLEKDVQRFEVRAMCATGANPMSAKDPQMSKVQYAGRESFSAVETVIQNAYKKIDTARELIQNSQARYDSSIKTLKESNDELGKVLVDLAEVSIKKIDFENLREILVGGIKALAKLREQWENMVRFFQMISNLIKCCLSTSLENFIEATKAGQTMALDGLSFSDLMKDTIYKQAFQANKIAYVVHMISGTYMEISNQHLMDRITCLGNLVALDPKKDEHEITLKREKLCEGCKKAQEAIKKLVMEKKRDFDEQMKNRVAAIEREFKDILPARSPAAIAESTAIIKSGVEEAEVDQFT